MASSSVPLLWQPRTPASRLWLRLEPPNSIFNGRSSSPLKSSCSSIAVRRCPSEGLLPGRKRGRSWRASAAGEDALPPLEGTPVESFSAEIVSAGEDGVSSVIQVLLFVAFVGLSILTIGVIYIAVTDFLQKREREKLEKEEEAGKAKKGGKKGKVSRGRGGPRGFGQRIDPDESADD